VAVLHGFEAVQREVVGEEFAGQRMAVAGGDVVAAAMCRQTRQPEPAADLEDAFAGAARSRRQPGRELRARGPGQAEQRPCGRGDAEALRHAERVGELLAIEKGADEEIVGARDLDAFLLGAVAGHPG